MRRKIFKLLAEPARSAGGQTISESLVCSFIILIVLVGLLQVFHIGIAKLLTEYSAYRTTRTSCVGFADYLIDRSSRVGAIGASGKMLESQTSADFSSPMAQYYAEEFMIPEYISGNRWLKYEYWFGENTYDSPLYYNYDTTGANPVTPPHTRLWNLSSYSDTAVNNQVVFTDYPFPFFDLFDRNRVIFNSMSGNFRSIDMTGSSRMTNHARDYLVGGQ